jgi:hypothetical protein
MRHTSVLVPPMSKVTQSGNPAAAAMRDAASTPPAGPDSRRATGCAAASDNGVRPPAQVGVRDGGHGALVLAVLGGHRARAHDGPAFERGGQGRLVLRVAVGVEQADGYRIQAGGQRGAHAQRGHLFPRCVEAAGYLEAEMAGHQRFGTICPQVVERWSGLPGDLDDVALAFGADQGHSSARALQQGVGSNGRAVGQHLRPA